MDHELSSDEQRFQLFLQHMERRNIFHSTLTAVTSPEQGRFSFTLLASPLPFLRQAYTTEISSSRPHAVTKYNGEVINEEKRH
jgi:hypothetical protein